MAKDRRHYCHKCEDYTDHVTALYRNQSDASDTYDFRLCHDCEHKLWGEFLPETAEFPHDEGDEYEF